MGFVWGLVELGGVWWGLMGFDSILLELGGVSWS